MFQYDLEVVNNTFTARFGDRVGWTFLADISVVVFSYAEEQKTYFYDTETGSLPTVGSIIDFDSVALPSIYSIAVLAELSELLVRLFNKINTLTDVASNYYITTLNHID